MNGSGCNHCLPQQLHLATVSRMAASDETIGKAKEIVSEQLGVDAAKVSREATLTELGADHTWEWSLSREWSVALVFSSIMVVSVQLSKLLAGDALPAAVTFIIDGCIHLMVNFLIDLVLLLMRRGWNLSANY